MVRSSWPYSYISMRKYLRNVPIDHCGPIGRVVLVPSITSNQSHGTLHQAGQLPLVGHSANSELSAPNIRRILTEPYLPDQTYLTGWAPFWSRLTLQAPGLPHSVGRWWWTVVPLPLLLSWHSCGASPYEVGQNAARTDHHALGKPDN